MAARSDDWVRGYEAAVRDWQRNAEPCFGNPYPPRTDEHDGYEAAVYDLTQK